MVFLCTLATKRAKISSIYSKITKVGGICLRFSSSKSYPMFKDFSQKSDLLERHTPVCLTPRVPPPPPGAEQVFDSSPGFLGVAHILKRRGPWVMPGRPSMPGGGPPGAREMRNRCRMWVNARNNSMRASCSPKQTRRPVVELIKKKCANITTFVY